MVVHKILSRISVSLVAVLSLAACGGAESEGEAAGAAATQGAEVAAAEPAAAHPGKVPFLQCAACHALEDGGPRKVGPALTCIVGKAAGSREDFGYSEAFQAAAAEGLTWDRETLLAFVEDPKGVVPNNSMSFGGVANPDQREAIVAYIEESCSDGNG